MKLPLLLSLVVVAGTLAGCTSNLGNPENQDPILVTAPDDYTYLNQTDPLSRAHLHDYWGGHSRIKILDQTQTAVFHYGGGSEWMRFMQFFPDEGQVVPQGTGSLEVTIEMTPQVGDHVEVPGISWRGAASSDFDDTQPLADGKYTIPTNDTNNDLPHQVVSGWEFWFAAKSSDYNRYTGQVHLIVEAVRGPDPIPLYPGHPDQWNNATQIQLIDRDDELYDVYTNVPQPMCMPVPGMDKGPELCPHDVAPMDGRLVPTDASYVEIILEAKQAGPGFVMNYHGGDSRYYTTVEPAETSGATSIYRIPINGNGDGPYAKASAWRLMVRGNTPEGAVEYGSYHLTMTAYKEPSLQPVPFSPGSNLGLVAGVSLSQSERDVTMMPDTVYPYTIKSPGGELKVRLILHNGLTRDLVLDGPAGCDGTGQDIMMVGLGAGDILSVRCKVSAGQHTLRFNSANSAFSGVIRLENATFA